MNELYVIKNNKNSIVGKPSTDFDHLWEKASVCESMKPQGAPYVVEKFTLPVADEALSDKPKMRNKPVERRYYKNSEEIDRDDFYDELVLAEPTDEQMIQLENDPDGITLQGETFRVEKDREKEEEANTKEESIENPYVSPKPIKESLEDGIINMVVFRNTNSGFYDSIDYFDEDEAQEKADELIANPGKYSNVKIVRMKKNDQKKFLENKDEQDNFYDNGTIPAKYIEEETEINDTDDIANEEDVEADLPSLDDEAEGDAADDLSDEEISVEDTEDIKDEEEQGVPVQAVRDSEENLKFKDDELEG